MQIGDILNRSTKQKQNSYKENLAVFQEVFLYANLAEFDTPTWRTHTKFSNFLNILFPITRLLTRQTSKFCQVD